MSLSSNCFNRGFFIRFEKVYSVLRSAGVTDKKFFRLSSASCRMAVERASVGMLSGSTTELMPAVPANGRTSTNQPENARFKAQALLPSSSLVARKSLGLTAGGHSSFRTGLSLGKSFQLSNGSRWTAVWLDNTARVETDVPLSEAWDLWSDREGSSRWMPWIDSVKVLEDQPELSRWTLKYAAFGQNFEFSWLARNMKPTYHQKIHWRSVDGLPNRGAVRFYPRTPSSCGVQLTISFEVPEVLGGLAAALSPLVENILQQDLDRFAKFAKSNQLDSQRQ